MASRLFLRRVMGIIQSRINPASHRPISAGGNGGGGAGGSSFLGRLGQVRSRSRQSRDLTDLSDGFTYKHVHIAAGFLALYIITTKAQLAWKKPRLEAAIQYYDQQIQSVRAELRRRP